MTPAEIDRAAPARRPADAPVGYQKWRRLAFLHWPFDPAFVQERLPDGLEVDTFDGRAWVGLVPFLMTGVRPRWFPPAPGVSTFCETNVRTYVTRTNADGEREPGVYFFSLDAAAWVAVLVARSVWKLPYYRASMGLRADGDRTIYTSSRLWPGPRGVGGRIEIEATGPPAPAEPGTLDHFLCERYLLFTQTRGAILRGQVHHTPYPLRPARVSKLGDSLCDAAGFACGGGPEHVRYSDGVDVNIHALRAG